MIVNGQVEVDHGQRTASLAGRVLRAIVWWITGDSARATRSAAWVGQFIAFGFIVLGLLRFFGGAGLGGLWLTLIGWFLLDAARVSYAQVEITQSLRDVRVREVMTQDCPVVDGNSNLQTFVDEHLLRTGQRYRVGSAVIELTKLRAPCATQDIYGPEIKREIYDKQVRDGDHTSPRWALGGFYAAVVQAGLVRVGDEIMLESEMA